MIELSHEMKYNIAKELAGIIKFGKQYKIQMLSLEKPISAVDDCCEVDVAVVAVDWTKSK